MRLDHETKKNPGWRGVEDVMSVSENPVEATVTAHLMKDGSYKIRMVRGGLAKTVERQTWQQVQIALRLIMPAAGSVEDTGVGVCAPDLECPESRGPSILSWAAGALAWILILLDTFTDESIPNMSMIALIFSVVAVVVFGWDFYRFNIEANKRIAFYRSEARRLHAKAQDRN